MGITMVLWLRGCRIGGRETRFSRTQEARLGTMKSGRPHLERHAEILENTSSNMTSRIEIVSIMAGGRALQIWNCLTITFV